MAKRQAKPPKGEVTETQAVSTETLTDKEKALRLIRASGGTEADYQSFDDKERQMCTDGWDEKTNKPKPSHILKYYGPALSSRVKRNRAEAKKILEAQKGK